MENILKSRSSIVLRLLRWVLFGALAFGLLIGPALAADKQTKVKTAPSQKPVNVERLSEEVRHQLVMLPWYGVFDNLAYEVRGDTVILYGQVTRPSLKSDAEARVKKLEEVSNVINNIEVLPLSPNDSRIRIAAYRAIFSQPGLDRYAMMAVPPIHIIVKNGNLTLVGKVATEGDKNQAGIIAHGIPGVFKVTNNLVVER